MSTSDRKAVNPRPSEPADPVVGAPDAGTHEVGEAPSEMDFLELDTDGTDVDDTEAAEVGDSEDSEDSAAADGDDSDADDDDADAEPRRKGFRWWVAALAVLVALASCAAAGWQGYEYVQDRREQHRAELRDELTDLASSVFISTMTLSPDTLDTQLGYAEDNATAGFKSQIEQYKEQIRQALTDEGSHTDAQVTNAAVSELDEANNSATVLMIISANWYRDDQLTAASRQAMRVVLERVDDNGEQVWKVADMPAVGPSVPIGPSSESVQELNNVTDGDAAAGSDAAAGTAAGGDTAGTGNEPPGADSSAPRSDAPGAGGQ